MNELMNIQIPLWVVGAYAAFMCAVQALPRPETGAAPLYIWAYQFLHLLCLNLSLVIDPTKKLKLETTTTTTTTTSTDPPPVIPPATPEPVKPDA